MTERLREGSLTDKAVLQVRSGNRKVVYQALFASEIFLGIICFTTAFFLFY